MAQSQITITHRNSPKTTLKIRARNQLKGKIVAVNAGATTSHVSIDIGQVDPHRFLHQRAMARGQWPLRTWSANNQSLAPRFCGRPILARSGNS
jgi:hypothetical protein